MASITAIATVFGSETRANLGAGKPNFKYIPAFVYPGQTTETSTLVSINSCRIASVHIIKPALLAE